MTAIATRAEVDADRTLRLTMPCDLPPGPVDVVVQLPSNGDELPADVAEVVDSMALMADDELWRAARGRLADEARQRLEDLNDLQQRAGLSDSERQEHAALIRQYDLAVLVRAEAVALLRGRGHDVSGLFAP